MNRSRKQRDPRQAELRQLASLMRQPGTLPPLPVAIPLHKMAAARRKRDGPADRRTSE